MKWISDTHDCPCLMKTDMEKSGNVYDFLRVYYEEIDSGGLERPFFFKSAMWLLFAMFGFGTCQGR